MSPSLVLAGLTALALSVPASERLFWNARERTAAGVAALARGETEAATGAFDTALGLRPDDPVALYNAGTARIGQQASAAGELLLAAAERADPELAAEAWYNAGNAHLVAGRSAAAAAAYVEALRRRSDHAGAKFNLELARRQQERRQQDQQAEDRDGPSSQEPQEPQEPERNPGDPGSDAADRQATGDAPGAPDPTSPLPRFRDLPDMTAEQAAAILQAVESLERRQRRQRALEAAAASASAEIDW